MTDHRDALWTGLVIMKKLEDDIDNYLVSLDFPPGIIQFKRNQLRAHLQWSGSLSLIQVFLVLPCYDN